MVAGDGKAAMNIDFALLIPRGFLASIRGTMSS